MRSALYEGTLLHARTTPARNVFRYPVCFYGLDLDELPELDRRLRLFGYNRRNVLTFRDADHLGPADRPVTPSDSARTIYHLLGIDGSRSLTTAEGRPVAVNQGGSVVAEIVA